MRLLFLTDTQARGSTPQNRKDDFFQTLLRKLDEVVSLANGLGASAIVHGGDLFDAPAPSLGVGAEVGMAFLRARMPVYVVLGNHDEFGHNPSTVGRTMAGLLARLGVIRLLEEGEKVFLEEDGFVLQLTGQPYHYEIDIREPELDYCISKDPRSHRAVHVAHGMLVSRPLFPGAPFTPIDRVSPHTEADVTLVGHNHIGFGCIESGGKLFVNPGALVRVNNHPLEMSRVPRVSIVDINSEGARVSFVELKCAKPGDEVLDRAKVEEEEFRAARLAGFVQQLRSSSEFKSYGLDEIIAEIAMTAGASERVKAESLRRIAEAREIIGNPVCRGLSF